MYIKREKARERERERKNKTVPLFLLYRSFFKFTYTSLFTYIALIQHI